MLQKKQSAAVKAAKRNAAKLRVYKAEHARELAEIAKLKQAKFDAKKLAGKKPSKDASHYKPEKYSPADLIKVALIQGSLIDAIIRKKQSDADKKSFKEAKIQFRLEHPKNSNVMVTPVSIKEREQKQRKAKRLARKATASAPKHILLARIANAAQYDYT